MSTANVAVLGVATVGGATFNSGASLASQSVVGPTSTFPIATYTFKAANAVAGAVIKDVTFTVTPNTFTSISMGGKAGSITGSTAIIYGVNVTVPATSNGVDVPVTVGLVCTGTANGCTTNSPVATVLTLTGFTYNNGTSIVTNTVSASNVANPMYIYASKPTLTVDTAQKTGLVLGAENKVGEVTVAADAAGQIKVNAIKFALSTSGITLPVWTAVRIADGSTTVNNSSCTTAGLCTFTGGYTISAGGSKTLSLYATNSGSATASTTQIESASVDPANLSWDDLVGGATAQTGANLYNFPTGSYSIRQ
jgi:hypothetical protein